MMRRVVLLLFCWLIAIPSFAGLKRGEVGIRFSVSGPDYYASIMRKGWERPQLVRLGAVSEIESLSRSPSLYRNDSLYNRVFSPLQKYLRSGEPLFYVPEGQLRFVNLEALSDSRGRRLFTKYKFFRVSSLDDLPREKRRKRLDMPISLYGGMDYFADTVEMHRQSWFCHNASFQHLYKDIPGRLPYDGEFNYLRSSRDEIKFIFKLSKWNMTTHTGARAQEELFRQDTRRDFPYMMHVSTHSFWSLPEGVRLDGFPDDWLEEIAYACCGLLFSGAGYTLRGEKMPSRLNDGLLYAQEIITLDMHWCDMLVLGACRTADGLVSREGITGVQSAFKKAGVKTLLLTLDDVNDRATSAFMQYFYTYLVDGYTKHESLDRARRDMIRDPDFSDPDYWAPFIMLD